MQPPFHGRRSEAAIQQAGQGNTDAETAPSVLPGSTSSPMQDVRQRAPTGDDEIWTRMMENVSHADADSTNKRTSPTTSSSTQPGSEPLRKRVKFSGEPLAHSMLPHMDGHTEILLGLSGQGIATVDRRNFRVTNPPQAIHPQGTGPWLHANCQAHLDLLAHLKPEDQYYLYHMKKVFYFPPRSVTDALITIFFESVYPLLPVVDRRSVLFHGEMMYHRRQSSPLLFHSILFAACQFANESLLHDAGFNSIPEAKVYFFQCAKMLYSHDCEPDHLSVVQSLIFLTYWWMDYVEEKDMRYWVSCAVNMALTMGMHKTVAKSIDMSPVREAVWRRIFWTLFVSGLALVGIKDLIDLVPEP